MNLLSFLPPGLKIALALFLGSVGGGGAVTTLSALSSPPPNPPAVSSLTSPSASPSATNHGQQVRQAVVQCRAALTSPSSSTLTSPAASSAPTTGKPADPGAMGKCVSTVAKDNHGHSLDKGKRAGEAQQATEPRGHSGSHDKSNSKSGS